MITKTIFFISIFLFLLINCFSQNDRQIDWSTDQKILDPVKIKKADGIINVSFINQKGNIKITSPKAQTPIDFPNSIYSINLSDIAEQLDKNRTAKYIFANNGNQVEFSIQLLSNDSTKDLKKKQLEKQKLFDQYAKTKYGTLYRVYYNKNNNIIREGNTVHIFIDEFGKFYFTGLPTTAREDYNYKIHLFYYEDGTSANGFLLTYEGTYTPAFNMYGLPEAKADTRASSTETQIVKDNVKEIEFGSIGPFTGQFTVTLKNQTSNKDLINGTVQVAAVHHVSISASLIGSGLRNPENIQKYQKDNGDTTLIADDPATRGLIAIMATFYPYPRNLLFAPQSWKERIGLGVGTRIDQKLNENFLAGLSYDFARGGSIIGGVHYGRRNYVAGNKKFDFGKDPFVGNLEVKKEWQVSWFVGVNIDLRIFQYLFNPNFTIKP